MPVKELPPIKETPADYARVEALIMDMFRREIYLPLVEVMNEKEERLLNEEPGALERGIQSGRINFVRGAFTGRFDASISKELRQLGAKWDRKTSSYRIPLRDVPSELKATIQMSQGRFVSLLQKIDEKLGAILPERISDLVSIEKAFNKQVWKIDASVKKTIKNLTVPSDLTKEQAKVISTEYTNNMNLYIKEFAQKEIRELRKNLKAQSFQGIRYDAMVGEIKKSYGVSQNKAKFLARQETSLLTTKVKELRYIAAGVTEYRWQCVAGSTNHPVRPMHKALEGKVFSWGKPPVTNPEGGRNNPGQDYNCRCFARPLVTL